MAKLILSEAEKTFILHGVQDDLRTDGRGRRDVRPIVLESNLVTHATGSAHLRLANTDVLVSVKSELDAPTKDKPDQGRIEFFIDFSANADPEFEGRGGEDFASDISSVLAKAFASPDIFDLKQLSVLSKFHCWVLYVDVLILECGGNLFDAISMAIKAALFNTRIPNVRVTAVDGGEPELELSDDPYDGQQLILDNVPLLVTLSRIGNHVVVDTTLEEEACSSSNIVVAVAPDGTVTALRTIGSGSFHRETLSEALHVAHDLGRSLHKLLSKKLQEEEETTNRFDQSKIGFLG